MNPDFMAAPVNDRHGHAALPREAAAEAAAAAAAACAYAASASVLSTYCRMPPVR
jgi:hypothetical protein